MLITAGAAGIFGVYVYIAAVSALCSAKWINWLINMENFWLFDLH